MRLINPIAIVTGANSGMGLATTVGLQNKGYHVIMACRNKERGKQAMEKVAAKGDPKRVQLMILDLASLDQIRSFAQEFQQQFSVLDVLVNNAGVVTLRRETTQDGFESMMGVNHLGHFLLTQLLLPLLRKSNQGRIVNVSSGAHKIGNIHFDDPHLQSGFSVWKGYGQSKLANILFTRELHDRLRDTRITVNALHPGAVSTQIGIDRSSGFGRSIHALLKPFFLTPEQGADTALYLATDPEVSDTSGQYFVKRKPAKISTEAQNKKTAERLWTWSEQAVSGSTQ